MPKSLREKRLNAIALYQKAIGNHVTAIVNIEANVNPASQQSKQLVAFEKDKIQKLEKHIIHTTNALKGIKYRQIEDCPTCL